MTSDPRFVYSRLLEERRADIAFRERRHRALGYGRLAAVTAAAALVWLALTGQLSIVWITLPIAFFAVLVVIHDRLLRTLERRRRAQRFFERALARLDGKWAGTGDPGDRYLDPAHPYARDLDLFGPASLFELLSTARTHIGEDTLAQWLLAPADPATARARQQAVDEMRPRVDLREDLAVVAEESRTGVDPVSLAAWGEAPGLLERGGLHAAVRALTVLGMSGAAAHPRVRVEPDGSLPNIRAGLRSAARLLPGGAGGQRNVSLSRAQADRARGDGGGRGRARAATAFAGAGAAGTREFPLAAAGRAARIARYRRRAAFQTHPPAQPADGASGFARSLAGPDGGAVCAVDRAHGLRRGSVAAALRPGGPPMAHGHRRDGGAVLAGQPCL